MSWTTEYPTKRGFYWIRNYRSIYGESDDNPTVVEMDKDGDFYWPGSDRTGWKYQVASAEWQGPIEPDAEKPISPKCYSSIKIACRKCDGTGKEFVSWKVGEVDGKPVYGIVCRECWVGMLTPEQRRVYMV